MKLFKPPVDARKTSYANSILRANNYFQTMYRFAAVANWRNNTKTKEQSTSGENTEVMTRTTQLHDNAEDDENGVRYEISLSLGVEVERSFTYSDGRRNPDDGPWQGVCVVRCSQICQG